MMEIGKFSPSTKMSSLLHCFVAFGALSVPWIVQEKRQAKVSSIYSEKEWDVVTITDNYHFDLGEYEDKPLLDSLRRLGRKATRVSIEDETFDFNSTKAIVIRSAWGKYHYLDLYRKFLNEMDQNPTLSLINPGEMFRWHGKKSKYLKELTECGINIPETYWVHATTKKIPDLPDISDELGCRELVIKPASGNAGHGIERVNYINMARMQKHLFFLVRGYKYNVNETAAVHDLDENNDDFSPGPKADDVMIQCFQKNIRKNCERGVILIGGEVTHGVKKCPKSRGFLVHEAYGGTTEIYDPSAEEIVFAKQVSEAVKTLVGEPVAYLRVDVINDNKDQLALMEVAAGTAQLWLSQRPQAADAFAAYLDDFLTRREQAGVGYGTKESSLPLARKVQPRFLVEEVLEETVDTVQNGTKVLVWWRKEEKYYEGQIVEILHGTDLWLWRIRYEDGDAEWLNPLKDKNKMYIPISKGGRRQQFVPLDKVQNGTRVWVWWDKYEKYYEGRISDIDHEQNGVGDEWYWHVDYDDGDEGWLDASKAKVHIPRTKYNLEHHYVE